MTLIDKYKNFKEEHIKAGRDLEAAACDVYLRVFEKCERKQRRNKHEDFIMKNYKEADKLVHSLNGLTEDTFVQSLIKHAYFLFWRDCGFKRDLKGYTPSLNLWP